MKLPSLEDYEIAIDTEQLINSSLKIQYIAKQPCAASTRDL